MPLHASPAVRYISPKPGLLLVLTLCLHAIGVSGAREVANGYETPSFAVPYLRERPRIDGVIEDKEWEGALSLNALQTVGKHVSARQTRFWMGWDEDNLYIAMRSPLRPGERVLQTLREPVKDTNVVFDDSYEIWLDAKTRSPDGQNVFFQFLSNFAGARYDVMHEPAVGNMRLGWTSHWKPANRIASTQEGNVWEMEVIVPRTSLYKDTPFTDGFELRGLLARNYKRPWEQNSIEGTSSFSVPSSHSRYILSKTAPALHLLGIADSKAKTFGLWLSALAEPGASTEPLHWSFDSDSGIAKSGELQLEPGKLADTGSLTRLDVLGDGKAEGSYRIRVEQSGRTLLDWSSRRRFGDLRTLEGNVHSATQTAGTPLKDGNDVVALNLDFNPVRDYLRVRGDFINYEKRGDIARTEVIVKDGEGKVLASQSFPLDDLAYVRGVLPLPGTGYGDYTATLTAYDPKDQPILTRESKFTKKDPATFAWWNTPHGNIERVIEPWTPVKLQGADSSVWGRTMQTGAAGLPVQITSQGRELLTSPAYLEAQLPDGKTVRAEGLDVKTVSSQEHRAVLKVTSQIAGVPIEALVTVEFDGLYQVDMKLDPKKPVDLQSLRLVFPIRPEIANYIYAKGEGIRYGYGHGFLNKEGTGRIWDSTKVDSQPMLVGSFIPYVWIGNPKAGLSWFADSDEGWNPNNETPAIEVRRDGADRTDLVLNLISAPAKLDAPRKIRFGLQATPVKPMHEGWRMDSWWCGNTFQDFAQVQPKGGNLIFTSIPFPLDVEASRKMVKQFQDGSNAYIFGFSKYPGLAVPYFEHIRIGKNFVPEMDYFGDEWTTTVSEGFSYGKTFQDFMIHNLGEWAKATGIDGFYIDNMHPLADDNIEAGRGYRLPDGRIQPTYQMFDTRRYFLRMRAAFAEQGKTGKIVLHMTNNMIIPWVGAADVALDGEDHVIYPESGRDFMDEWSLERLRSDYPAQWGVAVNFLSEYHDQWDPFRLAKVYRAYTGMMLLHDVLMSANAGGLNTPVWIARDRFGIEANDVEFLPYWDTDNGLRTQAPEVYLSAWKRPGKILLAVVNRGEAAEAAVSLDPKKLGLPPSGQWKVSDAEEGTSITHSYAHNKLTQNQGIWKSADQKPIRLEKDGTLTVPIERHDYRLIIVESVR